MNSCDSRLSLYSPLRSTKEFPPSDVSCEYDEHQIDIEIPEEIFIDTTLGMKSQLLTSPNVIDIISRADVEKMAKNTHAFRDFTLEDFNNVQINDFGFFNGNQTLEEEIEEEQQQQKEKEEQEKKAQQSQVLQNMHLHNPVIEPPILEQTFNVLPKITSKDIQKATYNFGKTAIGTYMMNLIKKGCYDKFLNETLRRDETFIRGFKEFCLRVDYKTRHDFKLVWSNYGNFNASNNGVYNFIVALKKVTQEFLGREVFIWIEKKTKRKDYIPIYRKCAEVYRKGIENVEYFEFSEFF